MNSALKSRIKHSRKNTKKGKTITIKAARKAYRG